MNWHQVMDEALKLLKSSGAAAAEPLLLEALPLAGDKVELQAMTYFNLALVYYDLKRAKEAERSFAQAISLIQERLPKENELYGMFLKTIIEFYEKENRPVDSLKYYYSLVELTREMFGKKHPYVANLLGDLAEVQLKINEPAEAEKSLTLVLDIMSAAKGPDNPQNAPYHANLAKCYGLLGRPSDAEYHQARATALAARGQKKLDLELEEVDL